MWKPLNVVNKKNHLFDGETSEHDRGLNSFIVQGLETIFQLFTSRKKFIKCEFIKRKASARSLKQTLIINFLSNLKISPKGKKDR